MGDDPSNGYERAAVKFMAERSAIGKTVIENWVHALPRNASVLDIGVGHGLPLTPIFIEAGVELSAIDASPSLVAAFRENFPDIRISCEAAEDSDFYGESFDAISAVGVMFLLPEISQEKLISRISAALRSKGRFLFSAPKQRCEWVDRLTGQKSYSLGSDAYEKIFSRCGLSLISVYTDSGGSHYYDTEKQDS